MRRLLLVKVRVVAPGVVRVEEVRVSAGVEEVRTEIVAERGLP